MFRLSTAGRLTSLIVTWRFTSLIIICTLSLLAMVLWGPSLVGSEAESIVPWLFLIVLVSGFVWATVCYRIPCTEVAEILEEAEHDLERRASPDLREGDSANDEQERSQTDSDRPMDGGKPTAGEGGGDSGRDLERELEKQLRCPAAFAQGQDLSTLWTQFTTAWRGEDGAGQLRLRDQHKGIASPSDFFTTQAMLGTRWETIPDALPGVFTAVGLLGTFVGIAIGLADIPQGTSGGSPSAEDLTLGINTLIGGMSIAFSTSIVGIIGSVWWIFEFRWARRKLESCLSKFVRMTERLLPVEQPHETLLRIATSNTRAAEGLGALESIQNDSAAVLLALKPLTEDVASVKGGIQTLGEDMASALEPLIEQHIKEPIQNLNLDLGERQTQALGQMVTEFRDTLVSHVGEELHRFGEALKTARTHQSSTVAELEAFFLLLESVSETQLTVLDRGASVAATFDRGLSALETAQQAIEQAGSTARQIMKEAEALATESRRQMTAQEEAAKALLQAWRAERDVLKNVREKLLALTSELGDQILEFRSLASERIGEVFHSFDSEMAKVVEHLGGTLAELRETTEEFPGIAIRLVDVTSRLASATSEQHESITRGIGGLEEVTNRIAQQLDVGREELMQASERLPACAQEIGHGLDGFVRSIQDARTTFEEKADWAVRAAVETNELLDQNVTALHSASSHFPAFAHRMVEICDQFTQSVQRVEASATDLTNRAMEADRRSARGIERLSSVTDTLATHVGSIQTVATGDSPPERSGGVSVEESVDGDPARTPTAIVPAETSGARGGSDPAVARRQGEERRVPDAAKFAPTQRGVDPQLERATGEPRNVPSHEEGLPTSSDESGDDDARTRGPGRFLPRIWPFRRRRN